ncbi:MAG TPA: acyl carrier protein [Gammaproteobacteria bacterium]|nr:acyl carrier protein [Gammaproteobacteria bacterium]
MSVEQKVRGYILESFLFTDDDSALNNADSLLENGTMDSTGVMEVIHFLEEEFGITVEDEEMVPENLDSVDNIVAFVKRKTQ